MLHTGAQRWLGLSPRLPAGAECLPVPEIELGGRGHTPLFPALGRQMQEDSCAFEACLVYRVGPKTAFWDLKQRNPVSTTKQKKL